MSFPASDSQWCDRCRVAELTLDLRNVPKATAYRELEEQLCAVLEGID